MRACFLIILILYIFSVIILAKQDTLAPTGRFVEPKPGTVIERDLVRFRIEAKDEQSGIKEVRLFAAGQFYYYTAQGLTLWPTPKLIGKAGNPPYEIVWNIKDIGDQYFGYDNLYAQIENNAGMVCRIEPDQFILFCIDRNQVLRNKTAAAYYTKDPVMVDANLREWPDSMFLSVAGSGGRARFASAWTTEHLYFAIQVEDDYLFSDVDITRRYFPFKNNDTTGYLPLWLGDFAELCFNPKNIFTSIRSKSHKEILFSIQGIAEGNNTDFIEEKVYLWGNNIKTAFQLKGTLNKHDDTDTGYVIETAIPWSDLELKPAAGLSIGFDFFYQDFSEKGSKAIRETWSGISAVNNDNPSEWGKLTLVKEKSRLFTFLIILICIAAGGFGVILLLWKKSRQDKEKPMVTSESIQRAITFIQENYSKDISLSEIAKAASLSPTWLSTAFKKEVKTGLSQYIMELRIKKSCEFLLNTKKSVTEIAYQTGFKDQSHFTKIFKKLKKTTPSEFRRNS